jgi:mannose-6-phosphate isomerase-like protein (cupin superfamily)
MRASIALSIFLGACALGPSASHGAGRGTVYSPAEHATEGARWSEQEQQQPAVLRNLRRSPEASFHLLRVRTEQATREHKGSELLLMTMAGDLTVDVSGKAVTLHPGDVLEVPRATPYALRNAGESASVAYLVYTPALAADDTHVTSAPASSESAWKWNLWVQ